MKNGKIFDGSSVEILTESFKSSFAEMRGKQGIKDSNTIATGGMYLEMQLREILPEILNQVYPEMPLLKFMSVDNSGALMQSLIQRVQSFEGRHVAKHETANTSGTITVNRTAREQLVLEYEAGSEYSDTDLKRSMLLNENIDAALIEGHHISYMTLIDQIGFQGIQLSDGSTLTSGLANYAGVLSNLSIVAGSTFASSTGLQIYNTIQKLYNLMVGAAGGSAELIPNVIILPPTQFSIVTTTLMTGTSPVTGFVTVKQFIESQLGLKIYASNRLIGQGVSSTDRLIMLNNDRRNIRMFIPQPLIFAPISIDGFKYKTQSKFRIGGIGINRANAIGYIDTI